MPVVPIACLADNYAYAVSAEGNALAFVVDPSETEPVVACLDGFGLRLGGLLLTHHHGDHVDGVTGLLEHYGEVPVVAHGVDATHLRFVNQRVVDGQRLESGGMSFDVMHVPGHTLGAIAYRWEGVVFTGDTLFAAGCGRLFEGTAEQMYASLSKLAALPPETLVYCGHEYALQNLAFARSIEPGNARLSERIQRVQHLREANEPSVPSTMAEECATNPFLRCDNPDFIQHAANAAGLEGAALFAELRKRRNVFRT